MKTIKWLSLLLIILFIGACTVNNNLATEGTKKAPNQSLYKNGKFYNADTMAPNSLRKVAGIFVRYFTEKKLNAIPEQPLPMNTVSREQLDLLGDNEIHIVKLGHSSILLKVYGEFWLLDPVFAERASPFTFMGPKRFHPTPISIEALPPIDKVLISHNHYDHLDKHSVKMLADKTKQFLVPMGVAGDLAKISPRAKNRAEKVAFQKELAKLQADMSITSKLMSDANNKIRYIKVAIRKAEQPLETVLEEVTAIEKQLKQLQLEMSNSKMLNKIGE